jgi:hypothetical protein
MILILLLAFKSNYDQVSLCTIDRCSKTVCFLETPEGFIEVIKKPEYSEGTQIDCPLAPIKTVPSL